VKKIGAELLKPAKEKLQKIIEANSVGDRAAA
jgi:hypothetical protein